MSSPSIPDASPPRSLPDGAPESVSEAFVAVWNSLPSLARDGLRALARPVRATAFWSAVTLPFLNVALLFKGLTTTADTVAFLVLLLANLVALYVGRSHRRDG